MIFDQASFESDVRETLTERWLPNVIAENAYPLCMVAVKLGEGEHQGKPIVFVRDGVPNGIIASALRLIAARLELDPDSTAHPR